MVLEQLGIRFAGKWRFFCFGRRCSLDGGFLVIWADFWFKGKLLGTVFSVMKRP